ncbi:hypothetical protein ACWD9X_45050 [Streptomyces sp. NPDC005075]
MSTGSACRYYLRQVAVGDTPANPGVPETAAAPSCDRPRPRRHDTHPGADRLKT